MRQAKETETKERKSSGGLLVICLAIVAITLISTWIKLNANAWYVPFWICTAVICGFIVISFIKSRID